MRRLVEELTEEHLLLLQLLRNILYAIEYDAPRNQVWDDYQFFQKAVLNHLKKEDSQLYPILDIPADKEQHKFLYHNTLEFFAWWPKLSVAKNSCQDFRLAIKNFEEMLIARIIFEEKEIFPKYY